MKNLSRRQNLSALQSVPSQSAKITGFLVLFPNKRIRGRLRQNAGRKKYIFIELKGGEKLSFHFQ
jgi:hypothetical protein